MFTESLTMKRSIERWQGCDPTTMAYEQSREAIKNAFDEAKADILELHKDAARYQWLRSRDLDAIDRGGIFVGMTPQNVVINGDDLDKAIDAAMSAEG